MASGDATPIPVKNQAYRVTFPILDADGDLVTAAGSLDSEVSKDGGTFADCTNEATEIATASGVYYLDLTATEMNADTVAVIVKSTGGKTTTIVLYPRADGADFEVDVTHWNGTAVATPATAGYPAVTVKDGTGTGEIALTSGAIDTVTAVTNGVSLAAGAITDASLAGNMEIVFETDFATNYNTTDNAWVTNGTSFIGTGWNTGKTGYSLTQSFPTNFADMAITVSAGEVTVGTNNDKTGYTASTVSDKTGYSLTATTGLGDQTANITGNLSGSVGSVTGAVGSVTAEVSADVTKISGTAAAADNLEASALTIVKAACEGTPSTTVIQTDLAEATDDHYIGRVAIFVDGAAAYQATDITDYTGSTGTITVTALTTAPSSGDNLVIV